MSAVAYRRLSESIDLHRVEPGEIGVPATIVAVDSDALVPRADVEALAAAAPSARFQLIQSTFGHVRNGLPASSVTPKIPPARSPPAEVSPI